MMAFPTRKNKKVAVIGKAPDGSRERKSQPRIVPRAARPSASHKTKRTQLRLISEIYERLHTAFGPQNWWRAESAAEVVIGAILTQNTNWKNVLRALERLKSAGCIDFRKLRDLPESELAELIRPAGTFRVKAVRLKAFVEVLFREHGGSLENLLGGEIEEARRRLLAIHGVGPETADAILLYAAHRPSFVVDAYAKRILRRHFVIDAKAGYDEVRRLFQTAIRPDAAIYNQYHALLVRLGKLYCRAVARCENCPLRGMRHDAEL